MDDLQLQPQLKHVMILIVGGIRSRRHPRHTTQKENENERYVLLGVLTL